MNDQLTNEIARLVKEQRKVKNLTQQQLADLTGLSLRSVQRLEKGEVISRMYTLEIVGKELGLNDQFRALAAKPVEENIELTPGQQLSRGQKIVISISTAVLITLLIMAYIFQSPSFPETAFEMVVLIAAALVIYSVILFFVWR